MMFVCRITKGFEMRKSVTSFLRCSYLLSSRKRVNKHDFNSKLLSLWWWYDDRLSIALSRKNLCLGPSSSSNIYPPRLTYVRSYREWNRSLTKGSGEDLSSSPFFAPHYYYIHPGHLLWDSHPSSSSPSQHAIGPSGGDNACIWLWRAPLGNQEIIECYP